MNNALEKTGRQGEQEEPEKLSTYIYAFAICILLTLVAYFTVVSRWASGKTLAITLGVLAVLQAISQLFFFLPLGQGAGQTKRNTTFMFFIMLVCLLILVFGTLWIMAHLNSNLMPQMQKMPQIPGQ